MAASSFLSGVGGYVQIGSLTTSRYGYKKWSLELKAALPIVNNFLSGFQQIASKGVRSGALSISGPYDVGNGMGLLSEGDQYDFVCGLSASIGLSITAKVETIKLEDDIDGEPRLDVSAKSTGSYSAAIQ